MSRADRLLVLDVHLVAWYRPALILPDLARQVREVVREVVAALGAEAPQRVDVAFDDLQFADGSSG